MPILGAHQSIAGGLHKAVERAAETGCSCVQLFTANTRSWPKPLTLIQDSQPLTKNNNQWRAKAIMPDKAAKFQAALKKHHITNPIAHDSYLINLAAPDDELWRKSVEAFAVELLRAEQLGIGYVVMHPGSFTTSSEEAGLKKIIASLEKLKD